MNFVCDAGVEELFLNTLGRTIYCFGSGKYAEACVNVLLDTGMEERIKGFIDNDEQRVGNVFKIDDFSRPIISYDMFLKNHKEGEVIIVACADVMGVIDQITSSKVNNIYIYIWQLILSCDYMRTNSKNKIVTCSEQLIPKKIHYCWFGGTPIPEQFQQYIAGWKELCPDYEIIQWDETNYDIQKNQYMKQAYEHKKWGFVPDYARLDIIYNEGGIYLDTDVQLLTNLDRFLYQEGFAGIHIRKYCALGLGFGARKGNSLIKEFRDYYDDVMFCDELGILNLSACDLHQYKVLKKYGFRLNNTFQEILGFNFYPTDFFDGKNYYLNENHITDNTISIHHSAVSWFTENMIKDKDNRLKFFRSIINN